MNLRRSDDPLVPADSARNHEFVVLDEVSFRQMIALERKRTERSGQPVLLMLLDISRLLRSNGSGMPEKLLSVFSSCMRNTDVMGWYQDQKVVGVMFTEISVDDQKTIPAVMLNRVNQILKDNLPVGKLNQVRISMHLFPEDWYHQTSPGDPVLYPDIAHREHTRRTALAIKRTMDIVCSSLALLLLAPVFFLVALCVKLGSKGPILYQQERVGQFGRPFTFLKFRSMYQNNDARIHREFMKRVIKGTIAKGKVRARRFTR